MKYDVFQITNRERHLVKAGVAGDSPIGAIAACQGGAYTWNGLVLIKKKVEHKIYTKVDNGTRFIALPA
jgi:hypothetical protein